MVSDRMHQCTKCEKYVYVAMENEATAASATATAEVEDEKWICWDCRGRDSDKGKKRARDCSSDTEESEESEETSNSDTCSSSGSAGEEEEEEEKNDSKSKCKYEFLVTNVFENSVTQCKCNKLSELYKLVFLYDEKPPKSCTTKSEELDNHFTVGLTNDFMGTLLMGPFCSQEKIEWDLQIQASKAFYHPNHNGSVDIRISPLGMSGMECDNDDDSDDDTNNDQTITTITTQSRQLLFHIFELETVLRFKWQLDNYRSCQLLVLVLYFLLFAFEDWQENNWSDALRDDVSKAIIAVCDSLDHELGEVLNDLPDFCIETEDWEDTENDIKCPPLDFTLTEVKKEAKKYDPALSIEDYTFGFNTLAYRLRRFFKMRAPILFYDEQFVQMLDGTIPIQDDRGGNGVVVEKYISEFDQDNQKEEVYLRQRLMLYRGTLSQERKRIMLTVMKLQEAVCDCAYREGEFFKAFHDLFDKKHVKVQNLISESLGQMEFLRLTHIVNTNPVTRFLIKSIAKLSKMLDVQPSLTEIPESIKRAAYREWEKRKEESVAKVVAMKKRKKELREETRKIREEIRKINVELKKAKAKMKELEKAIENEKMIETLNKKNWTGNDRERKKGYTCSR